MELYRLKNRSKVEARKQGLHYGAYTESQGKPKTKSRPRWANNGGQKPFNLDFNSTHNRIMKNKLTKEEKEIVRETDEEYKLRGHFKRIFPDGNY